MEKRMFLKMEDTEGKQEQQHCILSLEELE